MSGAQKPEAPQNFESPQVFVSEAVKGLQDNPSFLEESIEYAFYKQARIKPTDQQKPTK